MNELLSKILPDHIISETIWLASLIIILILDSFLPIVSNFLTNKYIMIVIAFIIVELRISRGYIPLHNILRTKYTGEKILEKELTEFYHTTILSLTLDCITIFFLFQYFFPDQIVTTLITTMFIFILALTDLQSVKELSSTSQVDKSTSYKDDLINIKSKYIMILILGVILFLSEIKDLDYVVANKYSNNTKLVICILTSLIGMYLNYKDLKFVSQLN